MLNTRRIFSAPARLVARRVPVRLAFGLAAPPAVVVAGLLLGLGGATVCDEWAHAQGMPQPGLTAPSTLPVQGATPRTSGLAPDATDPFTVSGVTVDVSAPDTNAARDRAIAQAQRKAWDELARRNAAPGGGSVPVDDATLARAVQNFSVDDERLAPGRYQASMTFRFRPDAVRQVLGSSVAAANAGALADTGGKPVLVLPVTVQADGTAVLWEDRTPWRAAWEDRDANPAQAKSRVKLDVPFGDLPDATAISATEAAAGDRNAIAKIAAVHNAGGVVVVKTTLPTAGSVTPIQVTVTAFGAEGPRGSRSVAVTPDRDDRPEDLLNRAVVFSAAAIDELWREQTAVAAAPQATLIATAPVASLPAWIDLRQRLGQMSTVRVDLLALNRNAATVSIGYRGDIGAVQSEAARQGLMLNQSAGGWVVSAAPMVQPAAGAPSAPGAAPLVR